MSAQLRAMWLAVTLLLPCQAGSQPPDAPAPAQRAVQSSIGFKTEPSMTERSIRSGAVFALLAIGMVLSAYAYRYVQRQRLTGWHRRLKVLETLSLAPKTRLFLVEMDHRVILLGQHGTTLSVLADQVPLKEGSELPERAGFP